MRRFSLQSEIVQGRAVITGSDAHHIRNVLRLRRGGRIDVFDRSGAEYPATILSMTGDRIDILLDEKTCGEEIRLRISVGQSLLKGQKMDFLVQKLTELGVSAFRPFISERSISRGDMVKMHQKKARWEKISVEAAKQCGRNTLPAIHDVCDFSSLLTACGRHDLKIIFWEKASDNNLRSILSASDPKEVCVLIGPEGGFPAGEVETAVGAGFLPARLGPCVLRAETAALAVVSIIQYELGYLSASSNPCTR
ncbi:MAG: 16S rRNA (uracil(1498)-N(3))-methyltransferase [Pseudomonadota bacterium]